ncbi:MAG: NADH-quinone oxidoreductase subunit N [Acidobacteriota bacterium]|nr:NADH-quinone oxidoreductase subunit N [Acidobacteriota bacterium]MDH3522436.1 NADH-quinone oxidoreductase subunit N [Acidobacteriota bacterium]
MPQIPLRDFLYLLPEIFLLTAGLLLLLSSSVGRGLGSRAATLFSLATLAATAVMVVWVAQDAPPGLLLAGMYVLDDYALYWKLLLLLATGLTVVLSCRFVEESGYRAGEFFSLLLTAATGMLLMAGGANLLSIWLSLELMALSSYVLAGYFKHETRSNEAALKYFILGALSSGVMLYGMSLLYGAAGSLGLAEIAAALPAAARTMPLVIGLGWLMLAIGLFFKVAAVPFHVWTPDVYVGAPTPVTAFLAAGSKAASFAILVRIFYTALPGLALDWQIITAAVAAVTMIWGNLAALTQTNVKRMLAYSSIAHAGYVLMGVLAMSDDGQWAVLFYLLAYVLITLGAFGTVILLERREYAGETYEDYAGLARRAPLLAAMMLLFMLALTGIPPTGGFFGKIYLFAAAVEAGWTWVAVIGVLTSALSLYYYLGIVVQMYLKDSDDVTPRPLEARGLVAAIGFCALATLLLGLVPGPLVELAKASVLPLP